MVSVQVVLLEQPVQVCVTAYKERQNNYEKLLYFDQCCCFRAICHVQTDKKQRTKTTQRRKKVENTIAGCRIHLNQGEWDKVHKNEV
jgi:hypothetical protein